MPKEPLKDFMCHCQPEGKARCEEMYAWALKDLECQPDGFINAIVYAMQWNIEGYAGAIDGIGCDMWCGISAYMQRYNKETEKYDEPITAYVQCDKVEHGLARIWKWAKEE